MSRRGGKWTASLEHLRRLAALEDLEALEADLRTHGFCLLDEHGRRIAPTPVDKPT